jgi:hypothetical protein
MPFHTYQLQWLEGKAKVDLVHQDRINSCFVPDGVEVSTTLWYKTRTSSGEESLDSSEKVI